MHRQSIGVVEKWRPTTRQHKPMLAECSLDRTEVLFKTWTAPSYTTTMITATAQLKKLLESSTRCLCFNNNSLPLNRILPHLLAHQLLLPLLLLLHRRLWCPLPLQFLHLINSGNQCRRLRKHEHKRKPAQRPKMPKERRKRKHLLKALRSFLEKRSYSNKRVSNMISSSTIYTYVIDKTINYLR